LYRHRTPAFADSYVEQSCTSAPIHIIASVQMKSPQAHVSLHPAVSMAERDEPLDGVLITVVRDFKGTLDPHRLPRSDQRSLSMIPDSFPSLWEPGRVSRALLHCLRLVLFSRQRPTKESMSMPAQPLAFVSEPENHSMFCGGDNTHPLGMLGLR
jgi:hypothetical protein